MESLKTALCKTAPPPNTIVVHRRNSQGIYQAEEVADYHDDPNIILHSKYSSRHRNGDRLDYTSATDNLLQEARGGRWSQEKLAVECSALIIDITKACSDEMLWYEDIMEEKSDRTTVRGAITSLHRLVNEMRGRKIAVDHHLKDSVDRLYRADNKKNSEKMKRCVECATSRKCLKAELKAHIENELNKDIALLTNKRKLTYEEKSYFKELTGSLERLSGYPENGAHLLAILSGDVLLKYEESFMHQTLDPVRFKMDDIAYFAHSLTEKEPEEVGLISTTGRYSGYKVHRGTAERGAVGVATTIGTTAGYVGGVTLLATLLGGPIGGATGLVLSSVTAPAGGALTGAVAATMLGDKEVLTPEEQTDRKRRQRINAIKQERFETGKGPIRGTMIGKLSSFMGGH